MPYNSGSPDIEIVVNEASALAKFKALQKAYDEFTSGVTKDTAKINEALKGMESGIVNVNNRAVQAQNRYIRSIEATAAAYGRSGVDKLIAQRDSIIKRLGTEEALINRVTAAYAKMIKVEQERGKGGGAGGGAGGGFFGGFSSPGSFALRGARDLFEGRTSYGLVEFGRSLSGLSGAAALLGGVAAGIAAVGVASFESFKSLAKFGIEIDNISLKTGLTRTEVQQFSIAAEASGGSIDSITTSMRMLSKGLADAGSDGKKARDELRTLGIDSMDAAGHVRPTSVILTELSIALKAIEDPTARNVAAIRVLGRAGIEAVPELLRLEETLKRVKQSVVVTSDADIAKYAEWNANLVIAEAKLAEIWRNLKGILATGAARGVDWFAQSTSGKGGAGGAVPWYLAPGAAGLTGGMPGIGPGAGAGLSAKPKLAEDLESVRGRLKDLKEAYDEARVTYDKLPNNTQIGVWQKQRAEVEKTGAAYRHLSDVVKELEKDESRRIARLERLQELAREGDTAYVIGGGALQRIVSGQEMFTAGTAAREAAEGRRVPSLFGPRGTGYIRPVEPLPEGMGGGGVFVSPEQSRRMAAGGGGVVAPGHTAGRDIFEASLRYQEERVKLEEQSNLRSIERSGHLLTFQQKINAEVAIEVDSARKLYDLRVQAAEKADDIAVDNIKYAEELIKIQDRADQRHSDELQRQRESIAGTASDLFHTLFTHPSGFGKQLTSTLSDAALRPVTQGLGEMVAKSLHPVIFGETGTGGIAGALRSPFGGGGISDVKLINNAVPVVVINPATGTWSGPASLPWAGAGATVSQPIGGSAMMAMLTGVSQAGLGGGGGGGGGLGGGGFSGAATRSSSIIDFGGGPIDLGGTDFSGIGSMVGGPGGTSGFGGPYGGGGGGGVAGIPTGGGGGIPGLLRGLSPKGLGSSLGNLKQFAGIGQQIGTGGTTFASVASSPAGLLGGTILAQQSLMPGGKLAGTPLGILGGAAGGALIGAQFGPWGAAIGAGVGFGIGLGEFLAGVEPQWKEAERLVKQQYGITINKDQANRIVSVAQQSYGNRVSLAVRSPEVRQMLGLYAAGTGQSLAPSASGPHGASLVESGGALYQNPVMQYGRAYSYQSSLPVYGGGSIGGGTQSALLANPGGPTGSGGGPTYLSFNFDGKSAGDALAGDWVTPSFVANRQASAWRSSEGRVQSAMALADPTSIVS